MKRESTIYTISDIVGWNEKGEIVLSPKYQRNSVWNESAKSYLIDTIIQNLSIPPVFIRRTIDVNTKKLIEKLLMANKELGRF